MNILDIIIPSVELPILLVTLPQHHIRWPGNEDIVNTHTHTTHWTNTKTEYTHTRGTAGLPCPRRIARPVLDAVAATMASQPAHTHVSAWLRWLRCACARPRECVCKSRLCAFVRPCTNHDRGVQRRTPTHYYKFYYVDVLERRGLGSRTDRWAGWRWLVSRRDAASAAGSAAG